MTNYFLMAAVVVVLILTLGLAGNFEIQDAERQRDLYCEMVEVWHESGGDYGWPPYDGECDR